MSDDLPWGETGDLEIDMIAACRWALLQVGHGERLRILEYLKARFEQEGDR